MKKRVFLTAVLLVLLVLNFRSAQAQTYRFQVPQNEVNIYIGADGFVTIEYQTTFLNDTSTDPIDFVDVGLPNRNCCSLSDISADIDGVPISHIANSQYVSPGIELGLGANAIQPGATGRVHVVITKIHNVLHPGEEEETEDYASYQFQPNYFGSEYVHGSTNLTVTIHLPPGLTTEEPRYYPPKNWPGTETPVSAIFDDGSAYYRWSSTEADSSTAYTFGFSFPARLVPASSIVSPPPRERFNIDSNMICCGGFTLLFAGFFGFAIYQSIWGAKRRLLKYLPPKVSIEGHGIKRGLTAIEAAILMEQPLDKILTMILFSTIKKNAATVITKEPLKLEISDPLPEGLQTYEKAFLKAFNEEKTSERRRLLQTMMIDLVKSVSEKMKGFSRKETIEFYKGIIERAWKYVRDADTPKVKMKNYDEVMDWTMLDKDYGNRTKEIFQSGPVYVPMWWGRYDPGFGGTVSASGGRVSTPSTSSTGKGGSLTMPTLPGSHFAASIVGGAQSFASGIIGDITGFTSKVTGATNPVPKPTYSSSRSGGGGGHSCACACACAGCACACAGGGR